MHVLSRRTLVSAVVLCVPRVVALVASSPCFLTPTSSSRTVQRSMTRNPDITSSVSYTEDHMREQPQGTAQGLADRPQGIPQNSDKQHSGDADESSSKQQQQQPPKFHHYTVCMVPPEGSSKSTTDDKNHLVWGALTKARTEMRDPGLYRWPPHANLLYPFVDPYRRRSNTTTEQGDSNDDGNTEHCQQEESDALSQTTLNPDILQRLQDACRQVEPFLVKLHRFGTFGGAKRGVLWIYPTSLAINNDNSNSPPDVVEHSTVQTTNSSSEPLMELQARLQEAFPHCHDQQKGGRFTPHMTISHFEDINAAVDAQAKVESWWTSVDFVVDEIYLLHRWGGDAGQFERLVTLGLGAHGKIAVHAPTTLPFCGMPPHEEEWVRHERMKMKERRNRHNGKRRGERQGRKQRTSRRSRPPPDTPEIVAQKRAERKAKREAMERQADGKE